VNRRSLMADEGDVLAMNSALWAMTGYSEPELSQMKIQDFYLEPADRLRLIAEVRAHRSVGGFDTSWMKKDGSVIDVRLAVSSLVIGGDDFLLTTAEDVTERRRTKEEIDFIFCHGEYAGRKIQNGPRVILLDLKLPKVDGLEVLRRVKDDSRTQPITVVMLPSSREERDINESYRLGGNSYITKPVEFDQFAEAVRDLGMY